MTYLTEDEMQTKWCPHHAIKETGVAQLQEAHNAMAQGGELIRIGRCIGSACSQWRWGQKRNPDWRPSTVGMLPAQHPADEPSAYIEDRERGYCGLAGRF